MVCLNEIILGKWGERTERAGWQQRRGSGVGLQLLHIRLSICTVALNSVGIYDNEMSRRQHFWVINRLISLICLDPRVKNCCLHLSSYPKHAAATPCGG